VVARDLVQVASFHLLITGGRHVRIGGYFPGSGSDTRQSTALARAWVVNGGHVVITSRTEQVDILNLVPVCFQVCDQDLILNDSSALHVTCYVGSLETFERTERVRPGKG
jgi:hypothetical protein